MAGGRTYTQAEVDAILARAVERAQSDNAELSIDDLVQIGSELGISKEAVLKSAEEVAPDAAEETVGVSRFEPLVVPKSAPATTKAASPAVQIAAWRIKEKRKWFRGLFVYLIVNAFLAFVNLATHSHTLWFLWCAAGWGLGMAFAAMKVFFVDDETVQRRLHSLQSRTKRREGRRERRHARRELKAQVKAEIRAHVDDVVSQVLLKAVHSANPRTRVRLRARAYDEQNEASEDAEDFEDGEREERREDR